MTSKKIETILASRKSEKAATDKAATMTDGKNGEMTRAIIGKCEQTASEKAEQRKDRTASKGKCKHAERYDVVMLDGNRMTAAQRIALKEYKTARQRHLTVTKNKRKVRCYYVVTPMDKSPVTDTAIAMLDKAASIMAYTAINTAYVRANAKVPKDSTDSTANSGADPYLYKLMTQAITAFHNDSIMENIAIMDNANREGAQKLVRHTYRLVKAIVLDKFGRPVLDDNGDPETVRVRVPIMPYETLENTDKGRAVGQAYKAMDNATDWNDCKQVAWCALWDLVTDGVVQDFSDIWQYCRMVYSAVNKHVKSQRRSSYESDNYSRLNEYASRTPINHDASEQLDTVLTESACDDVSNALAERWPRYAKIVVTVWECTLANSKNDDKTVREIAEIAGVHFSNVSRWQKRIAYFLREERPDLMTALLNK